MKPNANQSELRRAVLRARLAIFWEGFWPRAAILLTLVGLFVSLSWLGLWTFTSPVLRFVLIGAFGLAALAALVHLVRVRFPTGEAAIRRVETRSGLAHRPASSLQDNISPVADGPAALTLWEANRRRLLASIKNLKVGLPAPGLIRRDPLGVRFLVPILLIVAFAVANGEYWPRIAGSLSAPKMSAQAFSARIDAWIDPPTYTRQAPIFLSRTNLAGDPSGLGQAGTVFDIPQGSVLNVRIVSRAPFDVILEQAGNPAILEGVEEPNPPQSGEVIRTHQSEIAENGRVIIRDGSNETVYAFSVIPDTPPQITRGSFTPNRSGSFNLDFEVSDDYGVREGWVTFTPTAELPDDARPLVETPQVKMRIGSSPVTSGTVRAFSRLDDHPYAGTQVHADAMVRDDAGQEGRPSDDGLMVLPSRLFTNPIAQAVIEQRRILAMNANDQDKVAHAFEALTLYPERFIRDSSIYLGLDIARRRLVAAQNDDELREMLDYMWAMARQIETGILSEAEERLNAAREALEEALENGASEEEIAQLMEELRQAMNDFLRQFAEQMTGQQDMTQLPPNLDGQIISRQDLDRMLDRIQDLANLGDSESARELLSELQALLDNLQAAQRGQMMQGQAGEMMRQLEELGRLMREQQQLMDETFGLNQGQRPGEQSQQGQQGPLSPSELAEILRQLQQGQSDLHGGLQQLLEQMQQGQNGMPQPGQSPGAQALGRAGESMEGAAGSLGSGDSQRAFGQQGDALQAMREGLEGMMQQMFGQQQGPGNQAQTGAPQTPLDPLGRPQRTQGPDLGRNVQIPDEIDVERARRILKAIRDRLGERFRPRFELDYLERLLNTE